MPAVDGPGLERTAAQQKLDTEPGECVVDAGEGGWVREVAEGVFVHRDDQDRRDQVEDDAVASRITK